MEKEFIELVEVIEETWRKCPLLKEQTVDTLKEEPINEAKEVKEAIESKDNEHIEEEMGDLVYDALLISTVAEKQGIVNRKRMLQRVIEKIKRRKPWVFGTEKVKDSAEAARRWHEIKQEEKKKSKN